MEQKKFKFIIGTDWWTDCDDCMAMRVAADFHKKGLIEIIGLSIDACMEHSVCSLDAFMAFEGLTEIPVGIDLDATDYGGFTPYQKRLALSGKSKYKSNSDALDAVSLYRKCLAESDEKVHIAELGFAQVLEALLKSEPDEYSPLNGKELVKEKVAKLWFMGGDFSNPNGGIEHNFAKTEKARKASNYVCDNWQSPITFLGFEVARDIVCGKGLPENDSLALALFDHGSKDGRFSWDPCLILLACINDEKKAGYKTVKGKVSVDAVTGKNYFSPDENGSHAYVVKMFPDEYYREAVDKILFENSNG